jgi:hypothetical protein
MGISIAGELARSLEVDPSRIYDIAQPGADSNTRLPAVDRGRHDVGCDGDCWDFR